MISEIPEPAWDDDEESRDSPTIRRWRKMRPGRYKTRRSGDNRIYYNRNLSDHSSYISPNTIVSYFVMKKMIKKLFSDQFVTVLIWRSENESRSLFLVNLDIFLTMISGRNGTLARHQMKIICYPSFCDIGKVIFDTLPLVVTLNHHHHHQ